MFTYECYEIFAGRTKDDVLCSESDKTFGNLICHSMGFGSAEFCGLKTEYVNFMRSKEIPTPDYKESLCLPQVKYSGGHCPENSTSLDDCRLRDYEKEGCYCRTIYSK